MAKYVTIQKGNVTKRVSYVSFLNFFKDSDWVVAGDVSPAPTGSELVAENAGTEQEDAGSDADVTSDDSGDEQDEVADEEWDEAIAEQDVEKPLSEMTREELVAKANELGISVNKKNNQQLRDAIKNAM